MSSASLKISEESSDSWLMAPTLSPKFAAYVCDYLIDIGEEPDVILRDFPISYSTMVDSDAPLPLTLVADLFERVQHHCQDPHIALSMIERYHYESAGMIVLMVLASPDVESATKTLSRYDKRLILRYKPGFRLQGMNLYFQSSISILGWHIACRIQTKIPC